MSLNDPLANTMSKIHCHETLGRKECELKPISKLIKEILKILNKEGYVGEYKEIDDRKGGFAILNLIGKINKCGAIKPRHAVSVDSFEKFEKRYLPAKNFGILLVSTPNGIMTHTGAKEKKIGGRLLVYCY